MKISGLLAVLISSLSFLGALAAPLPAALDVLVTNPGGKVVFKGKTDGSGSFITGKLAAGDYVVQFKAGGKGPTGIFSIAAVGGQRAVTATAVAGQKFAGGGVAMRVQVAENSRLTGQVAAGDLTAVQDVKNAAEVPRSKTNSSDFLRRNQDGSGQGAASMNSGAKPSGQ